MSRQSKVTEEGWREVSRLRAEGLAWPRVWASLPADARPNTAVGLAVVYNNRLRRALDNGYGDVRGWISTYRPTRSFLLETETVRLRSTDKGADFTSLTLEVRADPDEPWVELRHAFSVDVRVDFALLIPRVILMGHGEPPPGPTREESSRDTGPMSVILRSMKVGARLEPRRERHLAGVAQA